MFRVKNIMYFAKDNTIKMYRKMQGIRGTVKLVLRFLLIHMLHWDFTFWPDFNLDHKKTLVNKKIKNTITGKSPIVV